MTIFEPARVVRLRQPTPGQMDWNEGLAACGRRCLASGHEPVSGKNVALSCKVRQTQDARDADVVPQLPATIPESGPVSSRPSVYSTRTVIISNPSIITTCSRPVCRKLSLASFRLIGRTTGQQLRRPPLWQRSSVAHAPSTLPTSAWPQTAILLARIRSKLCRNSITSNV